MSDNEDSSSRSSHGDTTDAENEVVFYWERLSRFLAHPVSLQLQCLLFVIGHIFELPSNSLALLPRSIRRQILLRLPAVDVCKLERTGITAGILMDDEIWEVLYNERMPLHFRNQERLGGEADYIDLYTPERLFQVKRVKCSWKEAYFTAVLSFKLLQDVEVFDYKDYNKCGCVYEHFLPDMLYGIYKFYDTVDIYQSFSGDKTLSIHNVYRCANVCPRLTIDSYYDNFEDPSIPYRDDGRWNNSWFIPVSTLVDVLANTCRATIKHFSLSTPHFQEICKYMKDYPSCSLLQDLVKMLSSVESITLYLFREEDKQFMESFLDIIFSQKKCAIKTVDVCDHADKILPYLISSPHCELKQLEVSVDFALQAEEQITAVLEHHQMVEKFAYIGFCGYKSSVKAMKNDKFIQYTANLLHRPVFKELVFSCEEVPSDTVLIFLRQFFSTPYPVSLSLNFTCLQFNPLLEPLPCHPGQTDKSLKFEDCSFSANLVSLLPSKLILKSLQFSESDWNTLHSFANLKSIKVCKFTLSVHFQAITSNNVSDICSLFHIVTAQEWDLYLSFHDASAVDTFTSVALPFAIGRLQRFVINDCRPFGNTSTVSLLETVFLSLSSSACFVFGFRLSQWSDSFTQTVRETWKRCGAVKLKRLEVFVRQYGYGCGVDEFKDSLSDMALEVVVSEC